MTETASALGRGNRDAADLQIETIAFEPRPVEKRPSMSPAETARIFQRDHFTCCYCGRRTIPSVVMRCFSALRPRQFPFHPHGKTSEAHFAYWVVLSSLEHLEAGTRGGDWTDEENLAWACWPCNQAKGNSAKSERFTVRAPADGRGTGWPGSIRSFWVLAGRPKRSANAPWLRAWHGVVPNPS
ncbi:hypothetical protein AB0L40_08500 [Patulibacter sp. NPDC049589]|uniref:HNH endonuclease n=1 Tax=Patulibacter sp. NPDC049589 TaxID=3154731 RepID=UPI00341E5BA2